MQQSEIQEVQVTVQELQDKIDRADLLEQLHKNRAFKKIILDMYFKDRALELVKGTCQSSISETSTKIHNNALIGISSLQGFFNSIYIEANTAAASLDEHNALLDEVRSNA